ncbi:MAG: RnfABCDGE type electron transport complex subunit B [Bacteroidales bacterium]|nr:RnfABCDGE type electron transport complex subunit B [Bacteroidales bacterium]MCF8334944.1 RnfABCDGE type electron transport complex subunit B [Bacteroidales bacterium]
MAGLGTAAAVILYFIARKFKVIEDPRIDEVEEALPAANCGGCGLAGCRAFAEAIVKNETLEGMNCPVGGNEVMEEIAGIMGLEAEKQEPYVAVVRCNGSKTNAPQKVLYDGPNTCQFAHALSAGESGCPNGCLGCGDCEESCDFDAIHMNPLTGLPEVVEENCTACNACVEACPRDIIELRPQGKKGKRIYISCVNTEKGGPAKKHCEVACIGCGKCVTACPFDAITMENNLAYIDPKKCKLCRLCVPICPTNAILEDNFPEMSEKIVEKAKENLKKQTAKKKEAAKATAEKKEAATAGAAKVTKTTKTDDKNTQKGSSGQQSNSDNKDAPDSSRSKDNEG